MTTIAIVGAGSVGRALGARLDAVGVPVRFGVRDPGGATDLPGPAMDPASAAAGAEIVFLAVPAAAAVDALRSLGDIGDAIVVDCTNPLRWEDGPVWDPPQEGSVAERLVSAVPGARVVKGFNHFGAEVHADPELATGPALAMFAGDDAEARRRVTELASTMGFAAVDAGPLRNAGVLENLAVLWIHLASVGGRGRQYAFVLAGRG